MPLTGNVPHDIKTEIEHGKPQKQAVAIALKEHREKHGGDSANIFKDPKEYAKLLMKSVNGTKEALLLLRDESDQEAYRFVPKSFWYAVEREIQNMGRSDAGRKYYTLLDENGHQQFGDYSRSVVAQELRDMAESEGDKRSSYKIVESGDTQQEINAAVVAAGGRAFGGRSDGDVLDMFVDQVMASIRMGYTLKQAVRELKQAIDLTPKQEEFLVKRVERRQKTGKDSVKVSADSILDEIHALGKKLSSAEKIMGADAVLSEWVYRNPRSLDKKYAAEPLGLDRSDIKSFRFSHMDDKHTAIFQIEFDDDAGPGFNDGYIRLQETTNGRIIVA